jgi:hypothetical protein
MEDVAIIAVKGSHPPDIDKPSVSSTHTLIVYVTKILNIPYCSSISLLIVLRSYDALSNQLFYDNTVSRGSHSCGSHDIF